MLQGDSEQGVPSLICFRRASEGKIPYEGWLIHKGIALPADEGYPFKSGCAHWERQKIKAILFIKKYLYFLVYASG